MLVGMIVFGLSLFGIVALFAAKHWEVTRGREFAPRLRVQADQYAIGLKKQLMNSRREAAKLPPFLLVVARVVLSELALLIAALGRMLEREAHRLADLVSYKRGFERRETKSEFLKQVSDHKNGHSE